MEKQQYWVRFNLDKCKVRHTKKAKKKTKLKNIGQMTTFGD